MLSASGIGSGLDIDGLVSQLVAAEKAPQENRLLREEKAITAELSGFGALKGALSSLQGKLDALTRADTFSPYRVTSADSAVVSASAASGAAAGAYQISVQQLAASQALASGAFSGSDAEVGEGTLTIRFGTAGVSGSGASQSVDSFTENAERQALSLQIDSSNNTLAGIRDSINALDAGVTASIVNDQGGARLLLGSEESGVANSLQVEVSDAGDGNDTDAEGLSRLAFNTDDANLEQSAAAQDARFTLNGLELSAASNEVKGVLSGVDLSLKAVSADPVQVTVAEDHAAVTKTVKGFVDAYNQFVSVARNLTRYDANSGAAGALQGDSLARSVIGQVRSAIGGQVATSAGMDSLTLLGITTKADGSLELSEDKLNKVLEQDSSRVAAMFSDARQGVATKLDNVLEGFVASDGLLASRTESLQGRMESISGSRETLARRMESVESRYRTQFNALDTLLAQVNNTAAFLTQQLAALSGTKKS
ncbi:MAG: flagellar filament capping protein FliD [Parahaliea sp.]